MTVLRALRCLRPARRRRRPAGSPQLGPGVAPAAELLPAAAVRRWARAGHRARFRADVAVPAGRAQPEPRTRQDHPASDRRVGPRVHPGPVPGAHRARAAPRDRLAVPRAGAERAEERLVRGAERPPAGTAPVGGRQVLPSGPVALRSGAQEPVQVAAELPGLRRRGLAARPAWGRWEGRPRQAARQAVAP